MLKVVTIIEKQVNIIVTAEAFQNHQCEEIVIPAQVMEILAEASIYVKKWIHAKRRNIT